MSDPEQVSRFGSTPAAERMRECVVEAAVIDRTSGLVPEGLGGW